MKGGGVEIKLRATLGPEPKDDKEVVILGRIVRYTESGIEYEAGPKHRRLILEHFGLGEGSKEILRTNGEKEDEIQPGDEIELGSGEATEFKGVAAKANYLSLDCPDLQFPIKQCSRQMARPNRGS